MSTSCIKILIIIIIVIIINRLNWLAILIEAAHAIIHTIIVGSYPTLQFNTIPTAHPVSNATSKWRSQAFFFLHLQEKQAGFYDNIIKVIRGEPEYFKAAFYGLGFPTFLRVSVEKKIWIAPSRLLFFIWNIYEGSA